MKKDGKADSTIETAVARLTRLTKLCKIDDSEQVKATLATLDWQNNTKHHVAQVYTYFLRFLGKTWTPPKYTKEHGLPFIPTEQEIDTLVSAGSPRTATRLQILKETGARVGELDKLEWTHIDTERKTIYITAEKGSNSRLLPMSNKLIAMLNHLPRLTDKVFQVNKENFRKTFESLRNRTAIKLDNPRLKKIHLHTLGHFKGTTEYHKTKDIIHVKTVLGHKRTESTMLYINIDSALYLATSDEWTCKATTDDNEATQLIEAGFEYVMTTPSGLMQFRKRK